MIDGLLLTPLRVVNNPKGDIYHALKASSPGYISFGEAYFSTVSQGLVKGWKRHKRFTLNLVVPVGEIRFVLFDDRPGHSTFGQFSDIKLSINKNYSRLTVPPGVWMAFQGVGEFNLLMNIINAEHDPYESDNKDLSEFNYPGFSLGTFFV